MSTTTTRRSKAAVISAAKKPIEIWEYDVEPPAPGCVNLEVIRAGVCGTDLHLWNGDNEYDEPFILGHEGLGRVIALGAGVSEDHSSAPIAVGDHVYWNPIRPCYSCYECTVTRDLTGCMKGTFVSPARNKVTWASYAQIVTLQPSNSFYKVNASTPPDAFIALGCALPTMLKGLENAGPIQAGSNVLIQGCGAVGLAATMLARLAGARQIICIDSNVKRLEMVGKFGATCLLNMQSEEYRSREQRKSKIDEVVGRQGLNLAIECSGHASAVEEGLALLARNARYLLVGTWAGAGVVGLSPFEVVNKALKIIGTTYASPENYYQAARLVEDNFERFPLASCVTHHFPITAVEEALNTVASGNAVKVVIVPNADPST